MIPVNIQRKKAAEIPERKAAQAMKEVANEDNP